MNTSVIEQRIDQAIRFFLCLLIFFVPFGKAVIESAVVTCLILWIIKRALKKDFRIVESPLNSAIGFFLLACLFSVVASYRPEQSFRGFFTKTLEWFIIYMLVIEVFISRRQIMTAIIVLMVSALCNGMDTLVQYYWTKKDLFHQNLLIDGYRATGSFLHPNMLGAYLTVVILVALSLVCLEKDFKKRIFFGLTSLVLIWGLFLTFSRGAWMAVAIGILFFFVVVVSRHVKPWIRRSLFILALVLGALVVQNVFVIKKQFNVVKNDAETADWRYVLWQEAIILIREKPFFGHGLNTFMPVMETHLIESRNPLAVGYSASYAHNCYLQIGVETGIFGLSAFLAILVFLFRSIFAKIPDSDSIGEEDRLLLMGLLSALLAFLVHAFVDTNFYSLEHPAMFWFMVGITVCFHRLLSRSPNYAIK